MLIDFARSLHRLSYHINDAMADGDGDRVYYFLVLFEHAGQVLNQVVLFTFALPIFVDLFAEDFLEL